MRSVLLFLSLMAFWVILSGHFEFHLLVMGAVSSALTTVVAVRMGIVDAEGFPIHKIFSFFAYIPWLLWQILVANIDVARRVWSPSLPISPCMIRVPYETKTDLGTVTYANSITLTPGTVTVRVDEDTLLVHALTAEAAEALQNGEMHRRVLRFEGQSS